jgi:ribosomal protein S18 acetylase RimI-like enzyme
VICDEVQTEAIARSLESGRATSVRLFGGSMLPVLLPGITLEFTPVSPTACRRGDVVLVRTGTGLIAHRWVGGSPGRWVLQGDNYDEPDTPVGDAQVLGRAVGFPIGRWSLELPRADLVARALVRGLPALRRVERLTRAVGRSTWRRAQRWPMWRPVRACTIRPLCDDDLPAFRQLALRSGTRPDSAYLRSWRAILDEPRSVGYVAHARHRIVGYFSIRASSADPAIGYVGMLWVDRWYRGAGVGTRLLSAAIEHVRPLGYRELQAEVRPGSDAMRANLRLGFEMAPDLRVRAPGRVAMRLRFRE